MNRKERRLKDANIQQRAAKYGAGPQMGNILGFPPLTGPQQGGGGGGYGMGDAGAKPAAGQSPKVNPFIIPKSTGLDRVSQVFPSNYYVEWNISSWRAACDQATLQGWPIAYATLTTWAYERSPFIQSLFKKLARALDNVPFYVEDKQGNQIDILTEEFCNKYWTKELRREIMFSHFWGFTGINIDYQKGNVYKYPQQNIDCINRMLRSSTYDLGDGVFFKDFANLMYIQPSSSYEAFLGMMQPITARFIEMNLFDNDWLAAGKRLAFPLLILGYPQDDGAIGDFNGVSNTQINPLKFEAETIAKNIDPSKALVIPYTKDPATGDIQFAIETKFEATKAGTNQHHIYKDFDEMAKEEIMQLVFGGVLTATTGAHGNRSLGEVQERMLNEVILSMAEFVESVLNDQFVPRLQKVFKGIPDGLQFKYDRSPRYTIEDIEKISNVLNQNGKRLTDDFFEKSLALSKDYFEDAPVTEGKPIPTNMRTVKPLLIG